MKIIKLIASNIKNIKAIAINANGENVILQGKNGAGKSAVLDSIMLALTGDKMSEPIRQGQEKASVEIDLGEYKVRRVITAKTDRLEVANAEGARFTSPQALLDKIIGKICFDPMEFAKLKPKEQHNLLANLIGIDFDAFKAEKDKIFSARTEINRQEKQARAVMDNMPMMAVGVPAEIISVNDLVKQLETLQNAEQKRREFVAHQDYLKNQRAILEAEVVKLQTKWREIDGEIRDAIPPPEVPPAKIIALKSKIANAEKTNDQIRGNRAYIQKEKEWEDLVSRQTKQTEALAELDELLASKMQATQLPVEGLEVNGAGVFFSGKPFAQLSTGEQIRISTLLAMAFNPVLKVIIIREGAMLDKAGKNVIFDIAGKAGYQVFMEEVADAKTVGIFIEDGAIKE